MKLRAAGAEGRKVHRYKKDTPFTPCHAVLSVFAYYTNQSLLCSSITMTTLVEIPHSESTSEKNWLRTRLSEDMRKLTSAAARLRIHRKRKDGKKALKQQELNNEEQSVEKTEKSLPAIPSGTQILPNQQHPVTRDITSTVVRVPERKWSLSDLLRCLGTYVQRHCTHLSTIPSASDVATWVRCADRALQLNGWTINSFLLESHVVFTYMLLSRAFQHYRVSSLVDVKELVLMCLYISYTYNANEISYPLRPFLVKHDRVGFWDKCTTLSLSASSCMLRINQDRFFYDQLLTALKLYAVE